MSMNEWEVVILTEIYTFVSERIGARSLNKRIL